MKYTLSKVCGLVVSFSMIMVSCSMHPSLIFTATEAPTYFPQAENWPRNCLSLDARRLPVSAKLQASHIIYAGISIKDIGQIWALGMKDGSPKLLLDQLPSSAFTYGIGFLHDGFHFIMVTPEGITLSDLNGSRPAPIKINNILDDFHSYSPLWDTLNKVANPDAMGRRYSPDGTKMAVWKLGDPALVIINTKSGQEVRVLGYGNQGDIDGSWSPDGTKYAITYSIDFPNQYSSLYVVGSDGTDLQKIVSYKTAQLGHPYWSPDGTKIIFSLQEKNRLYPYTYEIVTTKTGKIKSFPVDVPDASSNIVEQCDSLVPR